MGGGVSIGLLSKVSAYGLLAVAGWAVLWMLVAQRQRLRLQPRRVLLALAAALFLAVVPWYVITQLREGTNVLSGAQNAAATTALPQPDRVQQVRDFLSYLWQFYLPRPPFLDDQFQGYPDRPLWQVYVQPFMGRFGWFQYGFSPGQSWKVVGVLVGALVAAGFGLRRMWPAVRRHWTVLVALVGGFVGYAVMINIKGWQYVGATGQNFEQVRYLFPMIGLYGLLVAVALVGFPARWRRPVAAGAVVLMLLHVVASRGLTFERYVG
jgi:hypothetical protein